MSISHTPLRTWRTPVIVIIAGCVIATVGFGIRSVFGLFLAPMTLDQGWSRETFALALAIQNLMWGIGMPVAGAIADRYGPRYVLGAGTVIYALGTWGMAASSSGVMLQLTAGVVVGTGIAFSSFSLVLAAMARTVGPERRSLALGLGTAASSLGQVLFSPIGQGFITAYGWHTALLTLAALTLLIIPLAFVLPNATAAGGEPVTDQTLGEALTEARGHRGYLLLTSGFFVCGFHVAFIVVHFPAFVQDLGLAASVGAVSLSLIGAFNIFGSFSSGAFGQTLVQETGPERDLRAESTHHRADAARPQDGPDHLRVRLGDGRALALDGAADHRDRRADIRRPLPGDPVRDRVPVAPDRKLHRGVAGRLHLRPNGVVRTGLVGRRRAGRHRGDHPHADRRTTRGPDSNLDQPHPRRAAPVTRAVAALPIRSFRDAYRRLEGALEPGRRAALARALASHTAAAVRDAGVQPLVVSSAPEVGQWAHDRGYEVCPDPPGGGLNAAARKVVHLAGNRPWLILHSDLPCLASGEVEDALEILLAGRHVLAPSYDGGTSALGGHGHFPFAYGVASFHRHLHAGFSPTVITSLGFQLDIDSPADLSVAARHPRGAWLVEEGLTLPATDD